MHPTDVVMLHESFARGRTAIARTADELGTHRARVDARVSALLGSAWTGEAAEAFDVAWQEWCAGADDVVEGLGAMAQLLGAVQRDLRAQDEESEASLGRIAARLLERLG